MFQALSALQLNQTGDYTPIPLNGVGGVVSVEIPAFAAGETGTYEVGIYEGDNTAPGFVEQRRVAIAPYRRFLSFQVPPSLQNPQLGLRLIQKTDLSTWDEAISPKFHLPPTVEAETTGNAGTEWDYADQLPAGV